MLKQLYRFNQAAGLAIHIQQDGSFVMDGCLLSIKQQKLELEQKFLGCNNINELNKHLPGKQLLAVNLSGKGILSKRIEKTDEVNAANFNQVLPNANIDDFYVQNLISADYSFVSVIRKAEADKWFNQLKELGYQPVILSLGPFAVKNIMGELNVYGGDFVFNGHQIARDEHGEWLNYHYDPSAKAEYKIKIQAETIDEKLLLPYAAAFQLILNEQIAPVSAAAQPYTNLLAGKQADVKFKASAMLVLITVFLLLVVNFILFSWLQSSNMQLNTQLSRTQQNTNDVKVNSDQVKEKEAILQGLGWDNKVKKSLLIDEVAAVLPHDVSWTGVTINPLDAGGSQQARSLIFLNNTIKVSGLAEKVLSVNEWLARIKTKAWVKSARLDSYAFNNELNTGAFTLTINY
jgi:Tfp pilus assembly protein PilN